jgi:hypothetical protein
MPYKTDKHALADQFLDRRVKLLECQKERIKAMHSEGHSITSLGKMFHVNKRLVQFVLFPERQKKNVKDRNARGGSAQYYVKEEHTEAIREHRRYKYEALKDSLKK